MRRILYIVGHMLLILGAISLLMACISILFFKETQQAFSFLLSAGLTIFIANGLVLSFRSSQIYPLQTRDIFILTFFSWVLTCAFATLPFVFSFLPLSYIDIGFEVVSSITTTGATVLEDLNAYPRSLILWRAVLQWLGGVGIVIMGFTILPILKIGGLHLFQSEFSDRSDKVLPQVSQLARAIFTIYSLATFACFILLKYTGISYYDSLYHALTTISTGGHSTYNTSIQGLDNYGAEWIIMFFMIFFSLPLIFFIQLLYLRRLPFLKDSQIRTYLFIIALASVTLWLWLNAHESVSTYTGIRQAFFTIISILSTTGFSNCDYSLWLGSFPTILILFLSLLGGCTGSTSGGIKIFRLEVLLKAASTQLKQLRSPHGVFYPIYNGKIISDKIILSVLAFLTLYSIALVGTILLGAVSGLDPLTSLSAAIATLSNIGPGVGDIIGPSGNYASMPVLMKWVYMGAMLLGRLEFITIMALFSYSFWKD